MRVTGVYRTVSTEAVLVVAWLMPVHMLGEEKGRVYRGGFRGREKMAAMEETLAGW